MANMAKYATSEEFLRGAKEIRLTLKVSSGEVLYTWSASEPGVIDIRCGEEHRRLHCENGLKEIIKFTRFAYEKGKTWCIERIGDIESCKFSKTEDGFRREFRMNRPSFQRHRNIGYAVRMTSRRS